MVTSEDQARIETIGARLAGLGPDTDSNDWPERDQILYKEKNPMLWLRICERAQQLAPEEAVVRIWLRLEEINGMRRLNGLWPIDVVVTKHAFVRLLIDKLGPDHPRYKRLLGLWCYHGAMIHHLLGRFDDAARCHETEVELAEDERGKALAVFTQRVEEVNAAVVAGCDELFMWTQRLLEASYAADEQLGKSGEDLRWRANVYCHMLFYGWLQGYGKSAVGLAEVEFLEKLPADLAPAFAHALPVIRAIAALWDDNYAAAEACLDQPEVKNQIDWHGNALLVKLAIRRMRHRPTRDVLAEIEALGSTEHGGHFAKAAVKNVVLPK